MTTEQLRMQMLAGIITEGEYKAKLEENAASNLELKSLAKQLYLGFKKLGAAPKLLTTKMEIGKKGSWDDGVNVSIFSDKDFILVNINSKGIGVPKAEGIKNNIEKSFPKAIFTPINGGTDWEGNPIISFEITPGKDMSESLNEGEVTVKDVEGRIEMYTKHMAMLEKTLKTAQDKIAKEKKKAKPNQYNIEKHLEDVEFAKDEIKKDKAEIKYDQKRLEKLKKKESLNEHFIAGGIVGVGAINQIPSRAKTDYEMAFEHFLGERYETKFENREQDLKEEEVEENLNESALTIAGGIVLGALGLKAILRIMKGISSAVSLARMTDPKELKRSVEEIGKEAMQKGRNPLQIALWMMTANSLIEKGEIKNGISLARTWGNIDKIDIEKVFSSSESGEVEELKEARVPGLYMELKDVLFPYYTDLAGEERAAMIDDIVGELNSYISVLQDEKTAK